MENGLLRSHKRWKNNCSLSNAVCNRRQLTTHTCQSYLSIEKQFFIKSFLNFPSTSVFPQHFHKLAHFCQRLIFLIVFCCKKYWETCAIPTAAFSTLLYNKYCIALYSFQPDDLEIGLGLVLYSEINFCTKRLIDFLGKIKVRFEERNAGHVRGVKSSLFIHISVLL